MATCAMVVFSTFIKQIVRKNGDNAAITMAREREGGEGVAQWSNTQLAFLRSRVRILQMTPGERKWRKSKKEMNSSKYFCIFEFYVVVILIVCKNTLAYLVSDFD
jgi:hypothetical protein